ncbi:MAG: hypothetical protein CVU09_15405 [Bacteroidetes bacterium HGW-Bacteroidetes-4]|jgi:hypothetical protein|nr:MAG: hypothetical protein CVU09_15405 [Bacteroidetes bacterium HGW-Bacteroidetes-4]
MVDNYQIFLEKLQAFINRYYKISLYRGILLLMLSILVLLLFFSFLEYFGWFSNNVRLFLFLSFLITVFLIFVYFITIPFLRLLGIFKSISHKHAIRLINNSFPALNDLLINIYELHYLSVKITNQDLVRASLNQKIAKVKNFRFEDAVSKKSLKPFIYYILSLLFLYLMVFVFNPNVIKEGTNRIIHFNQHYERDYGFSVLIEPNDLIFERGSSKEIHIYIEGETYPEELFMQIGSKQFLLIRISNNHYTYNFKNVNQEFSFHIVNSYFRSLPFFISVLKIPVLKNLQVYNNYPSYLNATNQFAVDNSNLLIPYGTKLEFKADVEFCDSLFLITEHGKYTFLNNSDFILDYFPAQSQSFKILAKNKETDKIIFDKANIQVISDRYPDISVLTHFDPYQSNLVYFKGIITDDYGFQKLEFNLKSSVKDTTFIIPINKFITSQEFIYAFDFNSFNLNKADYYFTIYDNDVLNSYKSTKSQLFDFNKPNFNELAQASQDKHKTLETLFEKSLLKVDELLRDIKDMKLKMINQNLSDFEKTQFLNSINQKQSEIDQLLDALKQENIEKNTLSNQLFKEQSEIQQKQQQIEDLLNNVLNDDLKKLLEEIKNIQQDLQNQNKLTENLEVNYKEFKKQLDRNLELLKRLEVEQNLEIIREQLLLISENQNTISKQLEQGNLTDSLQKLHLDDLQLIEQLQSITDSTINRNVELDNPLNLEFFQENLDKLNREMNEDFDSITQNRSEKHKKNSKSAKQLAEDLDKLLSKQNEEQQAENAESIRQILENLFYFSFEQESIVEQFSLVSANHTKFSELMARQFNLQNSFAIIRDSLYAVSKRSTQIGASISKKVFTIDNKLITIKDLLNAQNTATARIEQRNILEFSNDLILLLSESLKNIDNAMGGGGSSSNKKKKNKPSKGEPSASELRKSQESVKNQLEKMLNDLKNGKKGGSNSSSEQMAKMLAQQEIFQMMLMQLKQGSTISNEMLNKIDAINKLLEDNKRDFARKQISSQTINRQKQIVTRMLEIEKSQNEREFDEKRISKEAKALDNHYKKIQFEHEQDFINFDNIFNKSKLQLNSYYFKKYQDYLNKLKKSPNEKGN